MRYRFRSEAELDLTSAADFYESSREGLGGEFTKAVTMAVDDIVDAPLRWPMGRRGFRKYRLKRFPYCVVYKMLEEDLIEIYAVFHLRRKPGSWRR